jgi:flagellar basal-body rod modification protein FlgD
MPTMTIPPISANAAAATTDTGPAPTNPSAILDRDAFLKRLVAQLRYQDPSKPMDSSAMVAQSAQLSMVDQLATISKSLERQGTTDKLTLAGSMVGKQITFANPDGVVTSGVVSWVRFDGDEVLLGTGAWEVPYDGITSISAAPVPPPPVAPAPVAPTSSPSTTPAPTTPAPTTPAPTTPAPESPGPAV